MTMRARLSMLVAVCGVLLLPSTSHAAHHLWKFSQMFSNANGSTQFIQLSCTDNNEQNLGTFTVTAGANTFNFMTNLPNANTGATQILLATSNFGGLPGGVAPDYIIPANFFATGGGTLTYASGADSWAYGAVPTDGVHALLRNGTTATNAVVNFAGTHGTVNLATAVPALPTVGIALLVAALLLAGSGLVRRRRGGVAAA
jgi:hypothetical protein